jgi:hypothetical protein
LMDDFFEWVFQLKDELFCVAEWCSNTKEKKPWNALYVA